MSRAGESSCDALGVLGDEYEGCDSRHNTPGAVAYLDLVEAVERGAIDGDNTIDFPVHVSDTYIVQLSSWARMTATLLDRIVADAGSIRRASKLLGVPRSTLGAWLIRARRHLT